MCRLSSLVKSKIVLSSYLCKLAQCIFMAFRIYIENIQKTGVSRVHSAIAEAFGRFAKFIDQYFYNHPRLEALPSISRRAP